MTDMSHLSAEDNNFAPSIAQFAEKVLSARMDGMNKEDAKKMVLALKTNNTQFLEGIVDFVYEVEIKNFTDPAQVPTNVYNRAYERAIAFMESQRQGDSQ